MISGARTNPSRAAVAALLLALLAAHPAGALEVAGVQLPDRVAHEGRSLTLNGAGVRSKFFVDVYVGALYLPSATRDAAAVLSADGERRVEMHVLYDGLTAAKLRDAFADGFSDNLTPAQHAALAVRIAQLLDAFPDLARGDVAVMHYGPDTGTEVSMNGTRRAVIEGADFQRALLSVWLGERPASSGLKQAMLGSR